MVFRQGYCTQVPRSCPLRSTTRCDRALRAATGAKWTTSREALDIYCGLWPLDMRREFLCTVTLLRIMRLDAAKHPLATSFVRWNNHVRQDRRSFFHLATSFMQIHRRHRKIDDGGIAFAEAIPEEIEPPWISRVPLTELPSREVAVANHTASRNFCVHRRFLCRESRKSWHWSPLLHPDLLLHYLRESRNCVNTHCGTLCNK